MSGPMPVPSGLPGPMMSAQPTMSNMRTQPSVSSYFLILILLYEYNVPIILRFCSKYTDRVSHLHRSNVGHWLRHIAWEC